MKGLTCQQLNIEIGDVLVCHQLDLELQYGQSWAVLGPNGSGKTTLLHTLAGLRLPQHGHIKLHGQPIHQYNHKQRARLCSILLQQESTALSTTVLEYVAMSRHPHLQWWQWESADDTQLAMQALQQVGLENMHGREIHTLSGGEYRRMSIACLLCQDADIILLDEPANHLDLQHQIETIGILRKRYQQRLMIMAAHDINLCMRYCSHALLMMSNGQVIAGNIADTITLEHLERLYGIKMQCIATDNYPLFIPA